MEIVDVIEDVMVSPAGIDHGKARPKAEAAWLSSSGRATSSRGEMCPSIRNRPACDRPILHSGHSTRRWLAMSETLRFAEASAMLSRMVSRIFASWNQLDGFLRQVEGLRRAA